MIHDRVTANILNRIKVIFEKKFNDAIAGLEEENEENEDTHDFP
jgi:hypothetical protein